jgi:hypothetical protein
MADNEEPIARLRPQCRVPTLPRVAGHRDRWLQGYTELLTPRKYVIAVSNIEHRQEWVPRHNALLRLIARTYLKIAKREIAKRGGAPFIP